VQGQVTNTIRRRRLSLLLLGLTSEFLSWVDQLALGSDATAALGAYSDGRIRENNIGRPSE
jgi:hypothetical protein